MVPRSLIIAALLAVSSPLAAQEDWVWTSKRPDGHAPIGIDGGRLLMKGEAQLSYRFSQINSKGVWFGNDSLPLETTLGFYDEAPLALTNQTQYFGFAYGASENLTLMVNWSYSARQREQLTNGGIFYVTEGDMIGDVEVTGLYRFVDAGAYQAHIQLGALVPVAGLDVRAVTPSSSPDPEVLPYDMQPGSGTFGLLPGITVLAQNERSTVGAQFKSNLYFGSNARDYRLGNRFEASGWASVKLNEYFGVSARVRWQNWGGIQGGRSDLDPLRDPGNDGFFLEGERVDIPIGVNLYLPEGSRFAGHRLAVEAIFPVHHEYEGPQLGVDWGIIVGWQVVF